jgi:hypothetical protein
MGIVCGASGRFNLTQVGQHCDAFSFSIVASDSWFNPISRRNHSSGIVVDIVVAGSVFLEVAVVAVVAVVAGSGFLEVAVVALRLTTLAQDIFD